MIAVFLLKFFFLLSLFPIFPQNALYYIFSISYEEVELMSTNDEFEKLMHSLIKQIIKNRQDVSSKSDFVYDVIFYTLHSPKLMNMIKEVPKALQCSSCTEEVRLARIIELLALVNRSIDILLKKEKDEDHLCFQRGNNENDTERVIFSTS